MKKVLCRSCCAGCSGPAVEEPCVSSATRQHLSEPRAGLGPCSHNLPGFVCLSGRGMLLGAACASTWLFPLLQQLVPIWIFTWAYKAGARAWRTVPTHAERQLWFWWWLGDPRAMRCWCWGLCTGLLLAAPVPAGRAGQGRDAHGCSSASTGQGQKWPCCYLSSNSYAEAASSCHTGLQAFCHERVGLYVILVVIYDTWLYTTQCPLATLPMGLSDFLFPFFPTYLDKCIKEDMDYFVFVRFLNREAVAGALKKQLRRGPHRPRLWWGCCCSSVCVVPVQGKPGISPENCSFRFVLYWFMSCFQNSMKRLFGKTVGQRKSGQKMET